MTWLGDNWIDVLGWSGSVLLVYSILQTRVLRLRALNLVASSSLLVFNALIQVWPMVAMNAVLAAINAYFIVRLLRERGFRRVMTPPNMVDASYDRLGFERVDSQYVLDL